MEPNETICQELRQSNKTGGSIEQIYESDRISEVQYFQNGNLLDYYRFTYGSDGRIEESQYVNEQTGTRQVPDRITYNDKGKWIEVRGTNPTGNIFFYEAEYNGQNQLTKYTAKMERAGTVTVRYTIDYEWIGGNNTVRTYVSPTQRTVTRYNFDLNKENKRRQDQEAIGFLSTVINFNKNMRTRTAFSSTDVASGTTTESVTEYSYEYNEAGYPSTATVTSAAAGAAPTVSTTTFEYSCY